MLDWQAVSNALRLAIGPANAGNGVGTAAHAAAAAPPAPGPTKAVAAVTPGPARAGAAAQPGRRPVRSVPPSAAARGVAVVMLGLGLVVSILVHGRNSAFEPRQGLVLFTGFYVAAQAVERLLEIVLPPGGATAQAKADRAMIVGALATLLGIVLSLALGLRFLSAVQVQSPPRWLDVFVTGLVIGGGTKPLHDLIATIQRTRST
jgi:hypothetical protein